MKIITLRNNLKILSYPMQNTHSITVGLCVKAGSAYEDTSMKGATHLLEHLHFRRCGNFSQNELYFQMERMGSTLKATTYRDFTYFSMKTIPCRLYDCIEIFENLLVGSNWSDNEFDLEKQVVLNQILSEGSFSTIERLMRKVVFKKTSLEDDIMGSLESVSSLQKHKIESYKKQAFSSERVLFCLCGNYAQPDFENILKRLEKLPLEQGKKTKELMYPSNFQNRQPDVLLKKIQEDNFLEVDISFDAKYNETERDLLTVLNCILGEGVGSRLQKNIREEKCYSTDIHSYVEWYSHMAILHIRFSVEKRFLFECLLEIINELNRLKKDLTKADLDVSIPFYKDNHVYYEDDSEEMNFQLSYHSLILETEFAPIALENNQETVLKLQQYAQTLFKSCCASLVLLGNTNNIRKNLIVDLLSKL